MQIFLGTGLELKNALDKVENSQNSWMNFSICRNKQLPSGQQQLAQ